MTMPDPVDDEHAVPRFGTVRDDALASKGGQLTGLAELIGQPLLPWQRHVADVSMEIRADGKWAHTLNCVLVGRQNGKSALLVIRLLHALFVGDEELILFASQDRGQSRKVFEELLHTIDTTPALLDEVEHRRQAPGMEMVRTKDGSVLRILSTRQAAWRGYSADLVILDESRELYDRDVWSAAQYTMRARANPQLWTASTAGNAESVVLRDLVDRGRAAVADPGADSMFYAEYSADGIVDLDPVDPEVWVLGNPALGVLIQPDTLLEELRSDPVGFLTESLSVWTDEASGAPLVSPEAWARCGTADDEGTLTGVYLGVDMDFDRTVGHLVAAGWNDGNKLVVGVVESWNDPRELVVAERVNSWHTKLGASGVALDSRTCAGVADRVANTGIVPKRMGARDLPGAMSRLVEHTDRGSLIHANDPDLKRDLEATMRLTSLDGSWRLRRRDVQVPITATMALLAAVDAASTPRVVPQIYR